MNQRSLMRHEAAERLEEFGWSLIRYARRIKRACEKPETKNEDSATKWLHEARDRMGRFRLYLRMFRSGQNR